MRQNSTYENLSADHLQQPQFGGTGVSRLSKVADNLNLVSSLATRRGEVLIPLDSSGLVVDDYINLKETHKYSLSGNPIVPKNTTVQFVVTGPANFTTALVASDNGAAGSITKNGNIISYTAPTAPKKVTLTLDSIQSWVLDIRGTLPGKPTISTPVQGAINQSATLNVVGSAYSQGSAGAFKESVWEVANNPDFNGATQFTFTGAVSGAITQLVANRIYYLRTRHSDTTNQVSDWSDTVGFATKAVFLPSVEVAQILPTAVVLENGGATSFSAVSGFKVAEAAGGLEGRLVLTTDEADIINSNGYHELDRGMYVFAKNSSYIWIAQDHGSSSMKHFQSESVNSSLFAKDTAMSGDGRWLSASGLKAYVGKTFYLQYLDNPYYSDQILTPDSEYTQGAYFGPHVLNTDGSRLIMLTGDSNRLVVWKSALGGKVVAQVLNLNAGHGVGKKALVFNADRTFIFVVSAIGTEVFKIMDGQGLYMVSVKYQAHTSSGIDVGASTVTKTGSLLAVQIKTANSVRVDVIEYSASTNTLTSKTIAMPMDETRFGEALAVSADAAVLYVGSPGTASGGKVYRYSGVNVGSTLVTDLVIQHTNAINNPTGVDEAAYGRTMKFSRLYTELIVGSMTRVHILR